MCGMTWPPFALDEALAFVRWHALVPVPAPVPALILAFITSLIILRWRLHTTPQSCEDMTVPEASISPSRKRRKDRTKPSLSNTPGGGERRPPQHTEEAGLLEGPQSKSDQDGGKDRMAKRTKQPYETFLVLDVEGTCVQGSDFGYPNEIIVRACHRPRRMVSLTVCFTCRFAPQEWPVCLLRWKDKDMKGNAQELEIVAEFRSFVRPTWRPQLSDFCLALTGITQVSTSWL